MKTFMQFLAESSDSPTAPPIARIPTETGKMPCQHTSSTTGALLLTARHFLHGPCRSLKGSGGRKNTFAVNSAADIPSSRTTFFRCLSRLQEQLRYWHVDTIALK